LNQLPKVAVVILNYNGIGHLRQFFPSVMVSTYPNLEIVLADNCSADESLSWISATYPQVTILTSSVNHGYAGGYNFFLKQVEADYFVLLNSDVEVTKSWIEPVIELMEGDRQIAACQPKILSFHNKDEFEYAGAAGGWIDSLGYPFCRGRVFDKTEKDQGQYNDTLPVFWASGAAFFVRADLFHKAGGFNASFFAHQEEIDLCWRLQIMGYKIYVCPPSVVYHLGGGTLAPVSTQKVYLNHRNNLMMVAQHWPFRQLLWKLPVRFFLDAVHAWKLLLSGKPSYWRAVAQAHLSFASQAFKNNRLTGRSPKGEKPMGVYNGSIVWDYFVRGKKHFSEIVKRK
jgi:GT2 family glycosyltransferase